MPVKERTVARGNTLETIVVLRWALIVATSYLVLFSRSGVQPTVAVGIYIAAYLASNVALTSFGARLRSVPSFGRTLVLFDIFGVSLGLALSGGLGDFFPIYFLVVLIGALAERVPVAAGAAVLIGVIDLSTVSRVVPLQDLVDEGYVLRVPFLILVALFFAYIVEGTRRYERERRSRLRRRRRTQALAGITHDLKNPLAVIQSFAALLLDGNAGPLNPQQANMVLRIHASVRRVMQLAINLLDAARIEANRLVVDRRQTDLRELVADAISLSRSASELKGVALHLEADRDLPRIPVDALQIERVVTNVIDNAIKYSDAGGRVKVSMRALPGRILLRVQDNGPGISPQILSGIFDNYHRRQGQHSEATGVGLFIVDAIVRAHGGRAQVASTLGKGTTVRIYLPTHPRPATKASRKRSSRVRRLWERAFGGERLAGAGLARPSAPAR